MFFDFLRLTPKPFDSGYLPEQDGHRIFYRQFGNPQGTPVLCFHGGPGSRSKPHHVDPFDLKKQRVILFDQRGCGQSLFAGESTQLNSTDHLVTDAKRLLDHLNAKKAVICGGSWGATLALLFAQKYCDNVLKLIVSKIFLARPCDIDWLSDSSRIFYPDIMAQLESHVPPGKTVRAHYADLVLSGDEAAQNLSARLFGNYEAILGVLAPEFPTEPTTPEHLHNYKIYMHYDRNDYGVGNNRIIDNAAAIAHIPTLIVHNRLDMVCPVEQAWALHKALPQSKLVIVPSGGHGGVLIDRTLKQEITGFLV